MRAQLLVRKKIKLSQQYQEQLLIPDLILYACIHHGTYYKFYFKKLKKKQ